MLVPDSSIALPGSQGASDLAATIFGTATGAIRSIAGATRDAVLLAIETVEPPPARLALLMPIEPATTSEQIIASVLGRLANIALRLWPVWFTNVHFGDYHDDALGRAAVRIRVKDAAGSRPDLLRPWAEAAVLLALAGRRPRVPGTNAATELAQLCLVINRGGLVLIADATAPQIHAPALVHALEWLSRNAPMPVIVLFDRLPDFAAPFDRILHDAVTVVMPVPAVVQHDDAAGTRDDDPATTNGVATDDIWLGPVSGGPHPLSITEQRVWRALAGDAELAPLFTWNQVVETVHGKRPRVDLLWTAGRLVVELDGHADHSQFTKFIDDRHRDYELILSGYTVLRLANDDVAQDLQKSIEKIRNIVGICRTRMPKGD